MKKISNLHFITQDNLPLSHGKQAQIACEAGVRWIQFRTKEEHPEYRLEQALGIKKVCKVFGATFIVNDHVELAKKISADGVHLGAEDMSPFEAREILRDQAIIGVTINADVSLRGRPVAEAIPCNASGATNMRGIASGAKHPRNNTEALLHKIILADYIGLGPFRFTKTKKNLSPLLGPAGMSAMVKIIRELRPELPIIAIGGVRADDLAEVMECGVDGVAVSSAINTAPDKSCSARAFADFFEKRSL